MELHGGAGNSGRQLHCSIAKRKLDLHEGLELQRGGGCELCPRDPGGARRSQKEPGGTRRSQEEPGGAPRNQEEPGGVRRRSEFREEMRVNMSWVLHWKR